MDNEVSVRVRLKDGRTFRVEAEEVAKSVDNIGDKASKSSRRLDDLKKNLAETAAFKALVKSGNDTSNSLGRAAARVRLIWLAALVASPGLFALSGALIAVAGSAGAALLGGGALGIGGIAALAVGLGGIGTVAVEAVHGFTKVDQALNSYNQAVAIYGHGSRQAITAQNKLTDSVNRFGGQPMLRAITMAKRLRGEWDAQTRSARASVGGIFSQGLGTLGNLLPTLSGQTNLNAAAFASSLAPLWATLRGPEVRQAINVFGATFRSAIGPAVKGSVDLFVTLLHVAEAASPYVVRAANAFASWAHGIRESATSGDRLSRLMAITMSNLHSWIGLLGAAGKLLFAVFSGGAKQGQGLVDSLTHVLTRWTAFLHTTKGQHDLHDFFDRAGHDASIIAGALATLFGGIGKFLTAMGPGFTNALKGAITMLAFLGGGFGWIIGLVKDLGPLANILTQAWIAYKTAGLLASAANTILEASFITLETLGIAALVVGLVIAYKKIGWFHDAVDSVWHWIKTSGYKWGEWLAAPFTLGMSLVIPFLVKHFGQIVGFFAGLPGRIGGALRGLGRLLISPFQTLNHYAYTVLRFIESIPGRVVSGVKHTAGNIAKAAVNYGNPIGLANSGLKALGLPHIKLWGTGGIVGSSGPAIVGERGPELVNLPHGTRIDTQSMASSSLRHLSPNIDGLMSGVSFTANITLNLDGKAVKKVVAKVTRDDNNRK